MKWTPNERILILCEGPTVCLYGKSMLAELPRCIQRAISVETFFQKGGNPTGLVIEAKRREWVAKRERNPFDIIWLFFESDHKGKLGQALQFAKQNKYRAAYAYICIEHWFILHFEHLAKPFTDGDEAMKYLTMLWPEYRKRGFNAYRELKGRLETAVERAQSINDSYNGSMSANLNNPYFTVQELVWFFEEIKQRG